MVTSEEVNKKLNCSCTCNTTLQGRWSSYIARWAHILDVQHHSTRHNRKVCILDWCYMCKCNSESADHLFLHCPVALELWDMVFSLFGVCWVMTRSVVGLLACWQGRFGHHCNWDIWKAVPHCLLRCIWKERNSRCFEDNESSMLDLKLFFFRTLLDWFFVWRNHPFSSILDLLDFCNVRFWFVPPCILLVYLGDSLFLLSMNLYYLSKIKNILHMQHHSTRHNRKF